MRTQPRPERRPFDDRSVRLHGPDWVVASLGHLLGFAPTNSIVALWLRGGEVRLAQRIDVPASGRDRDAEVAAIRGAVLGSLGQTRADAAVLCAVADRGSGPGLPHADLVADLSRAIQACGCTVLDALFVAQDSTSDQRWWSYLCHRACCPPEGRRVPESVRTTVAAEFAWQGIAVQPSRDAIAAEFTGDPVRQAAVAAQPALDRAALDDLEPWRDRAIAHLRTLLGLGGAAQGVQDDAAERFSAAGSAAALQALEDVRVRDTVLWHLVQASSTRRTLQACTALLGAAPDGLVAPIATCTAIAAWLCGDGVRARFAVSRALAERPAYGLAALLSGALDAGMSGADWRLAMTELTEAQCRGSVEVPDTTEL